MKKLIIAFLALCLTLCACNAPAEPSAEATAQPAATQPATTEIAYPKAPDFTVYDGDGNPVKLSDFLGKPVVLNFWASWCGPCKREMPEFEEVYLETEDEVVFLMINVTTSENSQQDAIDLIAQLGYTFPAVYDLTGAATGPYGITAFPTTYFIDPQGYAVTRAVGAINKDMLLKGIDMIR